MKEQIYYKIKGYLQAFENLNTFTNHGSYYSFDCINHAGDVVSSVKNHLKEENEKLKIKMPGLIKDFNQNTVLEFKQEYEWEPLLIKEFEQFFLEVFYEEYNEKHKYAYEERKNCVLNFISILKELIADNLVILSILLDTFFSNTLWFLRWSHRYAVLEYCAS